MHHDLQSQDPNTPPLVQIHRWRPLKPRNTTHPRKPRISKPSNLPSQSTKKNLVLWPSHWVYCTQLIQIRFAYSLLPGELLLWARPTLHLGPWSVDYMFQGCFMSPYQDWAQEMKLASLTVFSLELLRTLVISPPNRWLTLNDSMSGFITGFITGVVDPWTIENLFGIESRINGHIWVKIPHLLVIQLIFLWPRRFQDVLYLL